MFEIHSPSPSAQPAEEPRLLAEPADTHPLALPLTLIEHPIQPYQPFTVRGFKMLQQHLESAEDLRKQEKVDEFVQILVDAEDGAAEDEHESLERSFTAAISGP